MAETKQNQPTKKSDERPERKPAHSPLPLEIKQEELYEAGATEATPIVLDANGNVVLGTQTYYPTVDKSWIPLIVHRVNSGDLADELAENVLRYSPDSCGCDSCGLARQYQAMQNEE